MSSSLDRSQTRALFLAGTVCLPPTFPETGSIELKRDAIDPAARPVGASGHAIRVDHRISSKVSIARTFFLEDVQAIFLPDDVDRVSMERGIWLIGEERLTIEALARSGRGRGMVYVREQAPSLLQVEAGMSAAESAEYYPPLPDDRSANHYRLSAPVCDPVDDPICEPIRPER